MSLADRVWDKLMTRHRTEQGPIGATVDDAYVDHVQLEIRVEDEITQLVDWLANKAVTLFEGDND